MPGNSDRHAYRKEPPQPPEPPQVGRRMRVYLMQAIGVPLLALIPILALFNVFGSTRGHVEAREGALAVEATYPTRFRLKMIDPLTITLRNASEAALAGATVRVDAAYLAHFSSVSFTPAPDRVTGEAYVFDLGDLEPGQAVEIRGQVQAEDYWGATGRIVASTGDGPEVALDVRTFVYP